MCSSDLKGYFQFTHLPIGKYYVYALKDADGNKKYNQPIEAFAFLDKPVELPNDSILPNLYAFAVEKEKKREERRKRKEKEKRIAEARLSRDSRNIYWGTDGNLRSGFAVGLHLTRC